MTRLTRHGLLFTGVVLLACLPACGGGGKSKGPRVRPPPLVSVVKVSSRDVDVEARAPVDLRPLAQADISSKTLGYLDAVLVDRGDRVKRGQLLALVRPSDLPDQLAALRGTLAQTQANLALARANASRARQLAPSGVVSQQELENTSGAVASGEANEAAIKSQIGAIATRLGETRIHSPIDGYVWQRRLDPGALVGQASGGVILTLVQIDSLRTFISVNERQAGGVRVGKAAYVELDAMPGRRFEGKVVRLAPGFDPTTRTLDVEVRIPNPNGELRPGMYGRGAIVLETHPRAAVISANAIQIANDRKYVFVLNGNAVQRREITCGFDAGSWLEVTKGLAVGEQVVTAGADGLATGTKVRVSRNVDPYSGEKVAEDGRDGGTGGAARGKL
ncbi:MAG: efflux RND transporter periplasmic adaptor subunit [Deltaproteobacteria bacterium]|nr:efflux RND transporter periplasmic adaptor subunit [Deltaproteobacteria bacterium]